MEKECSQFLACGFCGDQFYHVDLRIQGTSGHNSGEYGCYGHFAIRSLLFGAVTRILSQQNN